jgi:anthranilate phosphoribosyltransferase
MTRASREVVAGGDPAENAARMSALLDGQANQAEQDIVALNCAALLMTAGITPDLGEGARMARDAIFSGAAAKVLAAYVEASRG